MQTERWRVSNALFHEMESLVRQTKMDRRPRSYALDSSSDTPDQRVPAQGEQPSDRRMA